MGFGKKGKSSFTVNRSEEVLPGEIRAVLSRGSSSEADGGEGLVDAGAGSGGDRFATLYFTYFVIFFLFLSIYISFFFFIMISFMF